MINAINNFTDAEFVIFVLAVLLTLYTIMVALGWLIRGVGFSYFAPFVATILWIVLWFSTH